MTAVTAEGVKVADGSFIPSELVVWAAGVKGPDVLAKLDGLEVSRSNQLVVTDTLQTTRDPNIFAMGDCAYLVPKGESAPIPPRAQAAHQEASHLYTEIQRKMRGEPLRPFKYRDFGSLVSLGEYSTVGSLMGFIGGRSLLGRGPVCAADVPLALQDARGRAARAGQGLPRHPVTHADAAHRAGGQAALIIPAAGGA